MKNRPWPVKLIALFFLLVPLTEYLIILYAKSKWHVQLTPNLMFTAFGLGLGSLVTAAGVWKVRPWGFYVMIVFGLVIVAEDIYQMILTPQRLNAWEFIDIGLVAAGITLLNLKRVREPYFNPNIRWWERSARHAVDIPVGFMKSDNKIDGTLLDISATGCFAKLRGSLKTDEMCTMNLKFEDIMIEVPAKVMRISQKPEGVGLRFFDVSFTSRKNLKKFIRRLEKESTATAASA